MKRALELASNTSVLPERMLANEALEFADQGVLVGLINPGLVDTRGFTETLEQMLSDHDEQSRRQIESLEKELASVKRTAEDFEQKLDVRSDTINVLLSELARKSEQIESIGEIGDGVDVEERGGKVIQLDARDGLFVEPVLDGPAAAAVEASQLVSALAR